MKQLLLCGIFQPSLLLLSRIGSPGLIDKDAVREQDECARLTVAGIQTRGLNQRVCARLIAPWSQCTDELYCSLLFFPSSTLSPSFLCPPTPCLTASIYPEYQ